MRVISKHYYTIPPPKFYDIKSVFMQNFVQVFGATVICKQRQTVVQHMRVWF